MQGSQLPKDALVRVCDTCGTVNAIDINETPEHYAQMQLDGHTVMRLPATEVQELWKKAGRCDHKRLIESLRAQLAVAITKQFRADQRDAVTINR